jgi:hypothetical protein
MHEDGGTTSFPGFGDCAIACGFPGGKQGLGAADGVSRGKFVGKMRNNFA